MHKLVVLEFEWIKKSKHCGLASQLHAHIRMHTHYYFKVVARFESADYKGLFRVEQRSAVALKCSPAVWLSPVRRIR